MKDLPGRGELRKAEANPDTTSTAMLPAAEAIDPKTFDGLTIVVVIKEISVIKQEFESF